MTLYPLASHQAFWRGAAPSIFEGLVSAVSSDLLVLLNGTSQSSQVARDSLRHAMWVPADDAESTSGIVVRALRFLAGYGLYLTVGPDRVVDRIIDQLAILAKATPQSVASSVDPDAYHRSGWFCRVGLLANSVRRAVRALSSGNTPAHAWSLPQTWAAHLGPGPGFSPELCARAARAALTIT